MKATDKVANAVDKAFTKTDQLAPFGKAERITAGVCMGIPFFLMVAQIRHEERQWWWFPALSIFFLALPFFITYVAQLFGVKRKNDGIYLTLMFSAILIGLYVLFTRVFKLESLDSISAYVGIADSFIFGLLLMMAAMLFITNGLVYWEEYKSQHNEKVQWRAYGNVFLGLALAGVLLFPCTRVPTPHYIFAVSFFVGCAVGTVMRAKSRTKHKVMDFFMAGIMAVGFLIWAGTEWLAWSGWFVDLFNLFGAESVGLWVIGIDFILVSLKRISGEMVQKTQPDVDLPTDGPSLKPAF